MLNPPQKLATIAVILDGTETHRGSDLELGVKAWEKALETVATNIKGTCEIQIDADGEKNFVRATFESGKL